MTDAGVALWVASDRPEPDVACTVDATCARCGSRACCAPASKVVSSNFLDWDLWTGRNAEPRPHLCGGCTWLLRHKPLRLRPWTLVAGRATLDATPGELHDALSAPHAHGWAVGVPISHQKHVTVHAAWGHVAHDHGAAPWTGRDAERLRTAAWLRHVGFGEAALAEPSPRWAILRRLVPTERGAVLSAWPLLDEWRRAPWMLAVACRATRADKETSHDPAA